MSEKVEILTIDIHKGGGKYPFGMIGNCGTSGFGTPLTQEEFDDVDNLIERHRKQYEKEHGNKVKVKIIADCRANQTNLFGSPLKADIPAEIPTQLPRMIPTQIGEEEEDFEEDDEEEELEEEEEVEDEEEEPQTAKTTQEVVVCPNQNGQMSFKKDCSNLKATLLVKATPPQDEYSQWFVFVRVKESPQNFCIGGGQCFLGRQLDLQQPNRERNEGVQHSINWLSQMLREDYPNIQINVVYEWNGFPFADKSDEEQCKFIDEEYDKVNARKQAEREFAEKLFEEKMNDFVKEVEENSIPLKIISTFSLENIVRKKTNGWY